MAKTKNHDSTVPPISSVSSGIVAQKPAGVAQRGVAPLKGTTETRLKSEQDLPLAMIANLSSADEELKKQRERAMLLQMIYDNGDEVSDEPFATWVRSAANAESLGKDFDPKDPIDVAHAQFQRQNPEDRKINAEFESRVYVPLIINPRIPSHAGRDRNAPHAIIDDGFKIPTVKLDKNQARLALAEDIRTVSQMYATEAGMNPKDFAKVMGGIATIESSFGVLRFVDTKKLPFKSTAGGSFHYIDGTIRDEVKRSMSDSRVANRVASLGVNINDGISKSEAWTLKDDNILAGIMVAKRIVETVRKNPELKNDVAALATRIYQAHNLGDGGASAFARGGKQELDRIDAKAAPNNPMFFAGANSDTEISARYRKYVTGAIASASPLIEVAFDGSAQPAAIASARQDKAVVAAPTAATKANLPERAPV